MHGQYEATQHPVHQIVCNTPTTYTHTCKYVTHSTQDITSRKAKYIEMIAVDVIV